MTKEQLDEVRVARQKYKDEIQRSSVSINTAVSDKSLSPEGGSKALKRLKDANDWLANNPNATLLEITANRDSMATDIERITSTGPYIQRFQNIFLVVPITNEKLLKAKAIKPEVAAQVTKLLEEQKTWFNKNNNSASTLDYKIELDSFNSKLKSFDMTKEALQNFLTDIQNNEHVNTNDVKKEVSLYKIKQQAAEEQEYSVERGLGVITSTAISTFMILIIIVLCLSAGSIAANMAIGRTPVYRILYFIWGALPIFAPFVFIYAIGYRLWNGPIPYYAVLPVSIEAARSRLGKIFWWPFYWIPDQDAIIAYNKFQEAVSSAVV